MRCIHSFCDLNPNSPQDPKEACPRFNEVGLSMGLFAFYYEFIGIPYIFCMLSHISCVANILS